MLREIQTTADGSHTIFIPGMNTGYHSHHGAIGESTHVFIEAGLSYLVERSSVHPIRILEIGFGTGLNALLSLKAANLYKRAIHYTAVEPFPLTPGETVLLNLGSILCLEDDFDYLHSSEWEKDIVIDEYFTLNKINTSILQLDLLSAVNGIYFDAFAPDVQPAIWTQAVFEKLFGFLAPGGFLVTYCSKSEVRRTMSAAGFRVSKIPGPWGKREMVRAFRDLPE